MSASATHHPLTVFLQALESDIAAGTRNKFLAALGKKLVLAHIIPEEDFTKTGPPSDADLGGLLHKLHALGHAIDWTSVETAHADAITFFSTSGEAVMAEVKTAMLMRAQAQGSGTHHAEVELRQMLDYGEVQQTVASGEMQAWTGCLSARNLAGAQALLTTGSTFAKNMRRASLFAASGASKPVPKTEPCRAELNDSIRNFDALSGEQTRLATLRCLPGEADLLAPAIDETRKKLLGFANATGEQSVNIMIQAAGMLLPEAKMSDTLKWGTAKVQLALRAVTTVLENMIGPCMGLGCPDRAAAMLQDWAVWDDRFERWSTTFSTPEGISPPWHFAKLIILTPMSKWLSKVWLHWCGPTPHPGTMAEWLSEANLMTDPHHNLMVQEMTKLRLRHMQRPDAAGGSSDEEPQRPSQLKKPVSSGPTPGGGTARQRHGGNTGSQGNSERTGGGRKRGPTGGYKQRGGRNRHKGDQKQRK